MVKRMSGPRDRNDGQDFKNDIERLFDLDEEEDDTDEGEEEEED
jgi:hypothetical protein